MSGPSRRQAGGCGCETPSEHSRLSVTPQSQVVGARLLVGAGVKQSPLWVCQMGGDVRQPTGQALRLFPGAQTRESLRMPPPTLTQPRPNMGSGQRDVRSSSAQKVGKDSPLPEVPRRDSGQADPSWMCTQTCLEQGHLQHCVLTAGNGAGC